MIAVDAAHWIGPFGWLYRNTPGNLAASGICFTLAIAKARSVWIKHKAHEKWVAQHIASIHLSTTGEPASDHPEHGALTDSACCNLTRLALVKGGDPHSHFFITSNPHLAGCHSG